MFKVRQLTFSLVLFVNILLIFILCFEDRIALPLVLQFAGRLHPMVLHFPLALFFVGILVDWLQKKSREDSPLVQKFVEIIFSLYALGSVFTALFGLFLYKEGSYQGEDINLHKWLGSAASLLSIFILWFRNRSYSLPHLISLLLSLIALIGAGHLGAEVTHGEGFLTEPFEKRFSTLNSGIIHADSAVIYRDVIQPILNEKCINCHNPNKSKNDLLLTDFKNVLKGGKNKDNVVPGNTSQSLLYKYILLPMSDTLHMPPDGKTQLDPEEIKLIGWWINTGAKEHVQYSNVVKVDSIDAIMRKRFHPKEGIELINIDFADGEVIKKLNNPYRTVQQISVNNPYIAVFLGTKRDFTEDDLLDLKPVGEQVTSIDLGYTSLRDADLKSLSLFPHLRKLHLQNTALGDESIKAISALEYLELLNLSGTKITSASLRELAKLKSLKMLFIYNTNISESAIEEFKNTYSSIQIFSTKLDLTDPLYNASLTLPAAKIDSAFFRNAATVEIKLSRGKVDYFFTIDGSLPDKNSNRYIKPFEITRSCNLQVLATMEGWKDSPIAIFQLFKVGHMPDQYVLISEPDKNYSALADSVLFDGKSGSEDYNDRAYLNFAMRDLKLDGSFNKSRLISQLSVSYLLNPEAGIVAPQLIEIFGGSSKDQLKSLGILRIPQPPANNTGKRTASVGFKSENVRFIKIFVKNPNVLIPGISNKLPMKPSIFIDEISID